MQEGGRNIGVVAAGQRQEYASALGLVVDLPDELLAFAGDREAVACVADPRAEVFQDLAATLRVVDFRVELHAPEMVDTKGRQNVTSSTQYLHIGSWSDLVFVALQDTEVASNTKEQRTLFSNVSHLMYAKLGVLAGLHGGTHVVGDDLGS